MKRSTLVKPARSMGVPCLLMLLAALAVALLALPAAAAETQRVVFGSAGFTESNRFWTIARPEHLQYDPFWETLLDVDPAERQRLAQAIGDHLFEEFADIPLLWFYNEVVVNPKVVADWTYPGIGAGRSTHFHLLQAVK